MYELQVVRIKLVEDVPLFSNRQIACADHAVEIMSEEIKLYDREVIFVLNLDASGNVLNMNMATMGSISEAYISPSEIFKTAILSNAIGIILMHNHPSGDPLPSEADISMTKRMMECGNLMGIQVVDHIIVAGISGDYYSMRKADMIPTDKTPRFVADEKIVYQKSNREKVR